MQVRKIACIFLCLCLVASLSIGTQAASSSQIQTEIDELKKQEQNLQSQINELEQKRNENLTELKELLAQKDILDQQIALINQQILNVEEQMKVMKQQIADQQDACDQAAADYAALNAKYIDRIRAMEEGGQLSYWSVLFRANSLADFLDRLNMIDEIAQADRARINQLREASRKVEAEKLVLQDQQTQLQQSADDLAETQFLLAEKQEASNALLARLSANEQEFDRLMDESEKAQQELLDQIAQKEDEFDKAKYEEWLAAQPPKPSTGGNTSSGGTPSSSGWICPVPYYVLTSPFGMRLHPIHGDYRMHNGIDMAAAQGTPIYASRGGQVEIATYAGSAGNYVQINHGDGYRSVYMHMTHYIVSYGQYVTAGQVIGYVGSTGGSTGPHLHFGISYNGSYINPLPLIS